MFKCLAKCVRSAFEDEVLRGIRDAFEGNGFDNVKIREIENNITFLDSHHIGHNSSSSYYLVDGMLLGKHVTIKLLGSVTTNDYYLILGLHINNERLNNIPSSTGINGIATDIKSHIISVKQKNNKSLELKVGDFIHLLTKSLPSINPSDIKSCLSVGSGWFAEYQTSDFVLHGDKGLDMVDICLYDLNGKYREISFSGNDLEGYIKEASSLIKDRYIKNQDFLTTLNQKSPHQFTVKKEQKDENGALYTLQNKWISGVEVWVDENNKGMFVSDVGKIDLINRAEVKKNSLVDIEVIIDELVRCSRQSVDVIDEAKAIGGVLTTKINEVSGGCYFILVDIRFGGEHDDARYYYFMSDDLSFVIRHISKYHVSGMREQYSIHDLNSDGDIIKPTERSLSNNILGGHFDLQGLITDIKDMLN